MPSEYTLIGPNWGYVRRSKKELREGVRVCRKCLLKTMLIKCPNCGSITRGRKCWHKQSREVVGSEPILSVVVV